MATVATVETVARSGRDRGTAGSGVGGRARKRDGAGGMVLGERATTTLVDARPTRPPAEPTASQASTPSRSDGWIRRIHRTAPGNPGNPATPHPRNTTRPFVILPILYPTHAARVLASLVWAWRGSPDQYHYIESQRNMVEVRYERMGNLRKPEGRLDGRREDFEGDGEQMPGAGRGWTGAPYCRDRVQPRLFPPRRAPAANQAHGRPNSRVPWRRHFCRIAPCSPVAPTSPWVTGLSKRKEGERWMMMEGNGGKSGRGVLTRRIRRPSPRAVHARRLTMPPSPTSMCSRSRRSVVRKHPWRSPT